MELIKIKNIVPLAYVEREKFFLNENNEIEPLVEKVREHYSTIYVDGSTEDGRKAIKKLAAELNSLIKDIDSYGKEVVDILKAKPKKIDAGRKLIRDELSILYSEIRKPVTDYETEQARIRAEEEARIAEEQRKKDEELVQLKVAVIQQLREEQIRQEEEERAKREIEQKEMVRIAEEKCKKLEEEKRIADVNHQREVKNKAFNSLIANDINRDTAIKVIQLISENKVENVFIKY